MPVSLIEGHRNVLLYVMSRLPWRLSMALKAINSRWR